ncbi:beta-ketoacyl-ACP synthase II [Yinghuangia sp. ASG 101]|uniref:beta-ketoacyl-ACP synthase II n=1 Tax=Yinghuangia sp. ASG 101 TaxID=2896848 RepID=UPI001E2DBA97|nr:beta-ketoacyl-ACP synthase II [Yinghuangia sp. ASG 101]UGQ14097.1 beta-ketoacyl-ACP synthase II [Yinghuangia sp. ASG 101]
MSPTKRPETARTVVVTGLGATTPVGGDVASTWSALLAGKSGIRPLTEDWAEQLPVRFAGRIAVEPLEVMPKVEARRLDRSAQFAMIAAREAWQDAGYAAKNHPAEDGTGTTVEPTRLGVVIASGIGGVTTLLDAWDVFKEKGPRRVGPLVVPMLMPNSPSANVGIELSARAGVHTPVSACASGAEAVAYALEMIRSGRADVVVCGGTEAAIHPLPMAAFANMMAMSKRNDEPQRASRPYDKGRDGFVMGEGAGCLVLESAEYAAARGARVYAEVAGAGMTSDGHHIAQPEPEGRDIARAMALAVEDAGAAPDQVVHVNAHGTSTPAGDITELKAIRSVLGDAAADKVAVTSTKSMTGHLLGGTGAVESVATVLALYHRVAPPTINVDDPDDEVCMDIVRNDPRPLPDGEIVALNDSFGFGGHDVVVAFRSAGPAR